MKKLINATMILAAIIILAACGNSSSSENSTKEETANHKGHDMKSGETTSSQVHIKDDKLNAVYQHYVHLTNALISENAAESKIASNAIEAGAKELPGGGAIATNAAKITSAADIETQRTAYATLSNEFIALVKKAGLTGGELYVDFCPMALHDKGGYWLSSNKEIRNPYFGDKMMTCGEVKETIK